MKRVRGANIQPFLALLTKNLILIRRGWLGTLTIIGFPLLFIGLLTVLIKAFQAKNIPEAMFVDTSKMAYIAKPSIIQPGLLK